MIEVNLSYTLKSAISQSVTTQITLPSEPEPEPLEFPLRFAFGPSDMPDVEDYVSIKFGEFVSNEYLSVDQSLAENIGYFLGAWQQGMEFNQSLQPQNRYGWIGPDDGNVAVIIRGLDPLKQYNIQVVCMPAPVDVIDKTVESPIDVYGEEDGAGNNFIQSFAYPFDGVDGGNTGYNDTPHVISAFSPSENGNIYIFFYPLHDSDKSFPCSINSLTISESQ